MKSRLAIDAVRNAVQAMPDDRLTAARLAALTQLDQHGLPSTAHEDWKYTDLGAVIEISNQWLAAGTDAAAVTDAAVEAITSQFDADWLIIRNGIIDTASIADLNRPELAVRLLSDGDLATAGDTPLSHLNIALLQDGLTIQVAAGYKHDRTIGILVIDSAESGIGVSQTRVSIDLQDNGSASFIEYHASTGAAAHYSNSVVDMTLADDATANYVRIQNRASAHNQTGHLSASLSKRSQFHHAAFDFGGELVRSDLTIKLNGPESSATICGLYLAGGKQHIDNHTRVDHLVGPAKSQQEYRGILTDAARCIWNGKAVVHAGADGTDASQANHNLLLSEKAEVDAKPELEIYADDVKCTHGCTTGQIDPAQLFYLKARGIDHHTAKGLLIHAFATEALEHMTLAPVKQFCQQMLTQRMTKSDSLKNLI